MKTLFPAILFLLYTQQAFAKFQNIDYERCLLRQESYNQVINEVAKKNPNAISSLAGCLQFNHRLIFHACLIDPSQLKKSKDIFKDNENFVLRLVKINPTTLQYASDRLRNDKNFIKRSTFIYRDALKYADPKLTDDITFMREMITRDSRNYIFGSQKIMSMRELAEIAFKDNGEIFMYAPPVIQNSKQMAMVALKSDLNAFNFINDELRKDKDILKIYKKQKQISKKYLEEFITRKYLVKDEKDNVGLKINDDQQLFKDKILINRKYITKWQHEIDRKGLLQRENWNLITVDNRNYQQSWENDLNNYPNLSNKIKEFFLNRYVDKDTIEQLSLTYLWKVNDDPLTLAFNLYLLRPSNEIEIGDHYVNITSLTAIAAKTKAGWRLSVVDVIFDNEIRAKLIYEHGHKKYVLQDLYLENKDDKNPKIIFKVEDKFNEYFEIFGKMNGDKYQLLYRLDPLKINKENNYKVDKGIKRTREEQEEFEWKKMIESDENYRNHDFEDEFNESLLELKNEPKIINKLRDF